jgi:serine/threonine-protein kinase HipA
MATSHKALGVWMNGQRVGTWSTGRSAATSFHYDEAWIQSDAARVLSLSLPFTPGNRPLQGAEVNHYFENLLPDSERIRARLQSRFKTASVGAFDLLAAIGRDCVGAVQLLPEDEAPPQMKEIRAERLDEEGVARVIRGALSDGQGFGTDDGDAFRLSIAGAQEKTALLFHEGAWHRPHGATPTTHIFKLPLGLVGGMAADMRDSVENEWLCSQILRAYGLPTADCTVARFAEHRVLIVKRFDRAFGNGWIARLPQEDFCQALGCAPNQKYEVEGGPGMRDILRVLANSSRAEADRRTFVQAQLVFWLLAATDGHAKNLSLFHERGGTYRLTPLYDVLSAWPIIGNSPNQVPWQKARLAMAMRSKNAHWKLAEIQRRHWGKLGGEAGWREVESWIDEVIARTPSLIDDIGQRLPAGFPPAVADAIFRGMSAQVERLKRT